MKLSILLILSMMFGCARPPPIELYRKIGNNSYTHQCDLPIFYGMDKSVPEELKPVIIKAFDYWDSLFKYNLFFYIGDNLDEEIVDSEAMVVVKIVEEKDSFDKSGATTHISAIYNIKGCMPNPRIEVKNRILIFNDNSVETVLRHEIGHVLGFIDSQYEEDLMYKTINLFFYIDKPKEASEREKKAFEIYYKR